MTYIVTNGLHYLTMDHVTMRPLTDNRIAATRFASVEEARTAFFEVTDFPPRIANRFYVETV